MGIRFLAITQPFLANWAEIFLVTQETIIYRLVIENHDSEAFLKKTINFWWENGRGRHAGAKGSRASRHDQNVGPSGGTFGSTAISEKYFRKFRA